MSLKVCLVVGDNQTPHCGVKDYAHRLAEALCERGLVAEVVAPANWGWRAVLKFRRLCRERRFDVIHVQYPSIGVRGSLLPHCLGFLGIAPVACVTIHEYVSKGAAQRACTQLFRFSTNAILFTTDVERVTFERHLKALGPPHITLAIGSNVAALPRSAVTEPVVMYFGQIRGEKGLEAFLALARLSSERGRPFRFQVMGANLPRQAEYIRALQANAPLEVEWLFGLPLNEIAQRMSKAMAAYLPFPDGAGFRRGSLLASLVNGLPVITRVSAVTPPQLATVVLAAETAEQALAHVEMLYSSPVRAQSIGEAGRRLTVPFSWPSIAETHQALYEKLSVAPRATDRAVVAESVQPQAR
jgi:glycosyltransferase involved in cell wall biosynthesis